MCEKALPFFALPVYSCWKGLLVLDCAVPGLAQLNLG